MAGTIRIYHCSRSCDRPVLKTSLFSHPFVSTEKKKEGSARKDLMSKWMFTRIRFFFNDENQIYTTKKRGRALISFRGGILVSGYNESRPQFLITLQSLWWTNQRRDPLVKTFFFCLKIESERLSHRQKSRLDGWWRRRFCTFLQWPPSSTLKKKKSFPI